MTPELAKEKILQDFPDATAHHWKQSYMRGVISIRAKHPLIHRRSNIGHSRRTEEEAWLSAYNDMERLKKLRKDLEKKFQKIET